MVTCIGRQQTVDLEHSKDLLRTMIAVGYKHSVSRCLPVQNLLIFCHLREQIIPLQSEGYFPVLQNSLRVEYYTFPIVSNTGEVRGAFCSVTSDFSSVLQIALVIFSAPLELSLVDLSRHGFNVHPRKTINESKNPPQDLMHISSAAITVALMKLLTSVVSSFRYFSSDNELPEKAGFSPQNYTCDCRKQNHIMILGASVKWSMVSMLKR